MPERDLPSPGGPADPEDGAHPGALPDAEPGIEDPEADFVEQRLGEDDGDDEEPPAGEPVPLEAPEADVAEQRRAVPAPGEDDGRQG